MAPSQPGSSSTSSILLRKHISRRRSGQLGAVKAAPADENAAPGATGGLDLLPNAPHCSAGWGRRTDTRPFPAGPPRTDLTPAEPRACGGEAAQPRPPSPPAEPARALPPASPATAVSDTSPDAPTARFQRRLSETNSVDRWFEDQLTPKAAGECGGASGWACLMGRWAAPARRRLGPEDAGPAHTGRPTPAPPCRAVKAHAAASRGRHARHAARTVSSLADCGQGAQVHHLGRGGTRSGRRGSRRQCLQAGALQYSGQGGPGGGVGKGALPKRVHMRRRQAACCAQVLERHGPACPDSRALQGCSPAGCARSPPALQVGRPSTEARPLAPQGLDAITGVGKLMESFAMTLDSVIGQAFEEWGTPKSAERPAAPRALQPRNGPPPRPSQQAGPEARKAAAAAAAGTGQHGGGGATRGSSSAAARGSGAGPRSAGAALKQAHMTSFMERVTDASGR